MRIVMSTNTQQNLKLKFKLFMKKQKKTNCIMG